MIFDFLELLFKNYIYSFCFMLNIILSEIYIIHITKNISNILFHYMLCKSISFINNIIIMDDFEQNIKNYKCYDILSVYTDNLSLFLLNGASFYFPNYNYYCNNEDKLKELLSEWI